MSRYVVKCMLKNVNAKFISKYYQIQEALERSPEPEAHGKVLDNNPERLEFGPGIWKCWFLRRGKTGVPTEKSRGAE